MVKSQKNFHIGIEVTLDVIAGKWKPLILCLIGTGIDRNGQLLRAIPAISQKVLTQQLNQLIEDDILTKEVFAETPPHVEYHFTEHGESLRPLLLGLCKWGEAHATQCPQRDTLITPPVSLATLKTQL